MQTIQQLYQYATEELKASFQFGFEWHRPADWNFDEYMIPATTFWYILNGQRQLTVQGHTFTVQSGDLIVLPAHWIVTTRHLPNSARQPMHYMALGLNIQVGGVEWTHLYEPPLRTELHLSVDSQFLEQWRSLVKYRETSESKLGINHEFQWPAELSVWTLAWEAECKSWLSNLTHILLPYLKNPRPAMDARVREMCMYMRNRIAEPLSIRKLAEHVSLSQGHMRELFREGTGMSPYQYIIMLRLDLARSLILNSELPQAEIAVRTGFEDHSHFIKMFRKKFGVTPGYYRKHAQSWEHF